MSARVTSLPIPPGCYVGDDLLTPEQVAQWLGVKPSWIFEQTRQRAKTRTKHPFPHTKAGKYTRFSRIRIAQWLAENSV
jgi:predicted DNA-binding transcriptional regulator AlpA